MMRKIAIGTLMVALSLLVAGMAPAATISFVPSDATALVDDIVDVDVVVSDLGGEIVSAYDLDILYDDSILTVLSVFLPSASLGNPVIPEAFYDVNFAPGVVDMAGVSLLSDAELLARQGGDSVNLGTISFQATALGTSGLDFVFDDFNDVKGLLGEPLDLEVGQGSVRVVPEPSAALAFAVGAAVVGTAVRRRRG